jgi:hypothetical protein
MTRHWHILKGDKVEGPYLQQLVDQMVESGDLPIESMLSDGGEWITVGDYLKEPRPPVPPPVISSTIPRPPQMKRAQHSHVPEPPVDDSEETHAETSDAPPVPPPIPHRIAEPEIEPLPQRDRIVILGRRSSGKTIYLSSIYAKLWRSIDGLTAKALTGSAHKMLMESHDSLKRGEWPQATTQSQRIELELSYRGTKHLMVTLDFAGEMFARAFVNDQTDTPEVKQLIHHIDRAAAVLMLVDPSVIAGEDREAALEDDFGLVQAVQRIRNWPGGSA